MDGQGLREHVLRSFGATDAEVEELLLYNKPVFDHDQAVLRFPLSDEPFVEAWAEYAEQAASGSVFDTLKDKLIQFQFPIQNGISQDPDYQLAVRRGYLTEKAQAQQGLSLQHPESLRLLLYPTPAGRVPVLITTKRADFVTLVRALTRRNEPYPVPASMGASMVAGYNNWARIRALKLAWARAHSALSEAAWSAEFKRIIPEKALYQDRFILLSDGPYSAVAAETLGLTDAAWRTSSLKIRLEHECTHYFTRRVLGSMRNALFDELLADYMGLVIATGRFRASWFLQFMGLEAYPRYRDGGRLQNYQGKSPLSDGAFQLVQTLVYHAALNLERFDARRTLALETPQEKGMLLLALTQLTLEQLAADAAYHRIDQTLADVVQTYQGVLV